MKIDTKSFLLGASSVFVGYYILTHLLDKGKKPGITIETDAVPVKGILMTKPRK